MSSRMRRRVKLILAAAVVAAVSAVCGGWWATRVTPSDVLSFPPDELRSVKVCRYRGCCTLECAALGQALWPELIRRVGGLKLTLDVGWKGEKSSTLCHLSFDWGGRGAFQIRLWTRPSLGGRVVGSFEKLSCGSAWYYDNHTATELYQWLGGLEKSGALRFEEGAEPWCE